MKIQHREPTRYRAQREVEYPAISDQLDAAVKLAAALRDQGIQLPNETVAWIDACMAVKKKYPKPA